MSDIKEIVPLLSPIGEVMEECLSFVNKYKGKATAFLYLIRIISNQHPNPLYKIGSTTTHPSFGEGKRARTFDCRLRELANSYGCDINNNLNDMVVVSILQLPASDTLYKEKVLHNKLKPWLVRIDNGFGGKSKETYHICSQVYDTFVTYCKDIIISSQLPTQFWESKRYELGDDCHEWWDEKSIVNDEYNYVKED